MVSNQAFMRSSIHEVRTQIRCGDPAELLRQQHRRQDPRVVTTGSALVPRPVAASRLVEFPLCDTRPLTWWAVLGLNQ